MDDWRSIKRLGILKKYFLLKKDVNYDINWKDYEYLIEIM